MPRPDSDDRRLLLRMLEEAYRLPNWNETSLQAALRRVSTDMAAWRPLHARRSIADLAVHCAYWKYALRRRLTGAKRGSFPLRGSNWFQLPARLDSGQWSEYRDILEDEHEQLCAAIGSLPRKLEFTRPGPGSRWSNIQRIYWLAIHDGYHTGQVNLLKAMYRRAHATKKKGKP